MPYVPIFEGKENQYVLPFISRKNLIELGGGNFPIIHPNVDVISNPAVDIIHDLGVFPWPLKSESYDGIFAQYVLEHIPWRDVRKFISELYRITSNDGVVVIITANTIEQCKKVIEQGASDASAELLYGSQEFPAHAGAHKNIQSPEFTTKLFKEAGFNSVKTFPHPVSSTDFILEAHKMKEMFEREYFEDGTIGYREYRDFCTHYSMARFIAKLKPDSVLDIGCGRGYVIRILENEGIRAVGMDISNHCYHTRATDNFILWDVTKTPWFTGELQLKQLTDKEFDVCFSSNLLEHIPEDKIDAVIQEMVRVSKRGLHAIHYTDSPYKETDYDIDVTHVTMKTKQWWMDKFKSLAPEYPVQIEYPRTIEYEKPYEQPPLSTPPGVWQGADGKVNFIDNLNKLNIGSYKNCFYYGWINIDILDLKQFAEQQSYRFRQVDVSKGIPCADNEVDIIFHSHLLEHFNREEGKNFLKECYRVMKPGGILRISVPDAQLITAKYLDGTILEYRYVNIGVEKSHDDAEALHELLYANHKTLYDYTALQCMLINAGFKEIRKETPFTSRSEIIRKQTINTFPSLSCIIEATPDK